MTSHKKIVCVEWDDASGQNGWRQEKDVLNLSLSKCESVGYLVKKNKTQIILVQSIDRDLKSMDNSLTIPRKCVKRIVELK